MKNEKRSQKWLGFFIPGIALIGLFIYSIIVHGKITHDKTDMDYLVQLVSSIAGGLLGGFFTFLGIYTEISEERKQSKIEEQEKMEPSFYLSNCRVTDTIKLKPENSDLSKYKYTHAFTITNANHFCVMEIVEVKAKINGNYEILKPIFKNTIGAEMSCEIRFYKKVEDKTEITLFFRSVYLNKSNYYKCNIDKKTDDEWERKECVKTNEGDSVK